MQKSDAIEELRACDVLRLRHAKRLATPFGVEPPEKWFRVTPSRAPWLRNGMGYAVSATNLMEAIAHLLGVTWKRGRDAIERREFAYEAIRNALHATALVTT